MAKREESEPKDISQRLSNKRQVIDIPYYRGPDHRSP